MTDVVVFGGTGTLGTALRDTLSRVCAPTSKELDVRNDLEIEGYLRRTRPTVVINAVAMLGLDACERDPQSAIRLNAMFPCQLAKLGGALDFRLIHFSTDAVFPGADSSAYTEADAARPLNVYGATKYAGDCLIAAHGRGFDIVRVPTLFGTSSRSSGFSGFR